MLPGAEHALGDGRADRAPEVVAPGDEREAGADAGERARRDRERRLAPGERGDGAEPR